MHESSIARGILDVAVEAMRGRRGRIVTVRVAAGVLAGVQKESLEMYLSLLARGTVAEGAVLELRRQPVRIICRDCGRASDYDGGGEPQLRCSRCGAPARMEGGAEICVESIEVEE